MALAILKLIQSEGEIFYKNNLISEISDRLFSKYRKNIQIIFQDPFASLSPRLTIERIVGEGLEIHRKDLSLTERNELIEKIIKKLV